jgi:hypothetical protein
MIMITVFIISVTESIRTAGVCKPFFCGLRRARAYPPISGSVCLAPAVAMRHCSSRSPRMRLGCNRPTLACACTPEGRHVHWWATLGCSGGRAPEVPVHTVRFNFLSTRTFATMSLHPETAMHYGQRRQCTTEPADSMASPEVYHGGWLATCLRFFDGLSFAGQ